MRAPPHRMCAADGVSAWLTMTAVDPAGDGTRGAASSAPGWRKPPRPARCGSARSLAMRRGRCRGKGRLPAPEPGVAPFVSELSFDRSTCRGGCPPGAQHAGTTAWALTESNTSPTKSFGNPLTRRRFGDIAKPWLRPGLFDLPHAPGRRADQFAASHEARRTGCFLCICHPGGVCAAGCAVCSAVGATALTASNPCGCGVAHGRPEPRSAPWCRPATRKTAPSARPTAARRPPRAARRPPGRRR